MRLCAPFPPKTLCKRTALASDCDCEGIDAQGIDTEGCDAVERGAASKDKADRLDLVAVCWSCTGTCVHAATLTASWGANVDVSFAASRAARFDRCAILCSCSVLSISACTSSLLAALSGSCEGERCEADKGRCKGAGKGKGKGKGSCNGKAVSAWLHGVSMSCCCLANSAETGCAGDGVRRCPVHPQRTTWPVPSAAKSMTVTDAFGM